MLERGKRRMRDEPRDFTMIINPYASLVSAHRNAPQLWIRLIMHHLQRTLCDIAPIRNVVKI